MIILCSLAFIMIIAISFAVTVVMEERSYRKKLHCLELSYARLVRKDRAERAYRRRKRKVIKQ